MKKFVLGTIASLLMFGMFTGVDAATQVMIRNGSYTVPSGYYVNYYAYGTFNVMSDLDDNYFLNYAGFKKESGNASLVYAGFYNYNTYITVRSGFGAPNNSTTISLNDYGNPAKN